MRYSIGSSEIPLMRLRDECARLGKGPRVSSLARLVFCDLDDLALEALIALPGVIARPLDKIYTPEHFSPPGIFDNAQAPLQGEPIYAGSQASVSSLFWAFRNNFSPPLTGANCTVAILDTGVRETHKTLAGKVVYEANFSDSPTALDVYDHGTAVAFMAAGGRSVVGEEQGISPGAKIANIKMMNDQGEGTDESAVLALEEVLSLNQAHTWPDPLYIDVVNCSWGAPDDGNQDNPVRVACRNLYTALDYRIGIIAAAGNTGPGPSTILVPAVEPAVIAVGALTFSPYDIWQYSARGPTLEGVVKPDLLFFGYNLVLPSCASDDAFVIKAGTSFAAPAISGGAGFIAEWGDRVGAWQKAAGQAVASHITMQDIMAIVPGVCRKPQNAPAAKDNTYGYGMPWGDLLAQAVSSGGTGAASALTDIGATLVPVMELAVVVPMMMGLAKAMRVSFK